jgi:hypothetical protein
VAVHCFHFDDGIKPGFAFAHIEHQLKIAGTIVF